MNISQGNDLFLAQGAILVSEREAWEPGGNFRYEQVWEGTSDGIFAAAAQLSAQGVAVQFDLRGAGKKRLTATWGRDPSQPPASEVPYDRWDLEQEPIQGDLFDHPAVAREASDAYVIGDPKSNGAARYRKDLLDAIQAGQAYPLDPVQFPVGVWAFNLLARGVSHWEAQRPVLMRVRTFTSSYVKRWKVNTFPTVYSRAALITNPDFGMPSDIIAQLPDDPPDPPPVSTYYGWLLRRQRSGYTPATRKWDETLQWDFGWWQQGLYTFVLNPFP